MNKNEIRLPGMIEFEYENNKQKLNTNYRKKRHNATTRDGLVEEIQVNNWKHPSGREQPIRKVKGN